MSEKIDSWMAFYGDEFFLAVAAHSDDLAAKYLRVIWFYRSHNKCAGLLNDDEYLRNITRADRADWPRLKSIIFGEFFKQEKGVWHQKRAREIYQQALNIAAKNKVKTEAASRARWKNKSHDEF